MRCGNSSRVLRPALELVISSFPPLILLFSACHPTCADDKMTCLCQRTCGDVYGRGRQPYSLKWVVQQVVLVVLIVFEDYCFLAMGLYRRSQVLSEITKVRHDYH